MNITFLIGNGFDIGIGMKSKFKDFFHVYQEQSEGKPERIKQLSNEIGSDYKTWADFEIALGKYTSKFNVETKQDFLDQVNDFEEEFITYLREEEKALKINEDEKVGAEMKKALLGFYQEENLAPESSMAIKKIFHMYSAEAHQYNFVNFNYTFTLEACLDKIPQKLVCRRKYANQDREDKVGTIIHVHGHCDLHPIIGVNDSSQIANKDLAMEESFTRFFIKPALNKLLRQGNDTNATNIINQSTIICVYGMALGATDKKWWELLINWLKGNSYRQLIIFDYDEKYTTSTQFAWLQKEDAIISKLDDYVGSKVKVEELRSRIHLAVHKNIFSMNIQRRNKDDWKNVLLELKGM